VSELGLNIVRFSVIITAVVLTIFIMLSIDYTRQHADAAASDLMETTLAGRLYIQSKITDNPVKIVDADEGEEEAAAVSGGDQAISEGDVIPPEPEHEPHPLQKDVDAFFLSPDSAKNRIVCLYLFNEDETLGTFTSDETFIPDVNDKLDYHYLYQRARQNSLTLDQKTLYGLRYNVASCPVHSDSGRLAGLLEIYEQRDSAISIFRFAKGELWLSVFGIIALFSFGFYGIMQLMDIIMRPVQVDPTKILPFGRESVRPVLFFSALAVSAPLYGLLFDDGFGLAEIFGERSFGFFAAGIFMTGVITGLTAARLPTKKLLGFLAPVGAFVAAAVFAAGGIAINPYLSLICLLVSGFGLGVAYRTAARYQAHADEIYGHDDYSYLSPALGTVSGVLLGGFLSGKLGESVEWLLPVLLMAAAGVVAAVMLRDIKFTDHYGMNGQENLVSLRGPMIILSAVGLSVIYSVLYLPGLVVEWKMPGLPAAFCAVIPMIAFCVGNRLRLTTRGGQRLSLFIAGALAAASFFPMIIWASLYTLVLSILLSACAVVFLSAAMYSVLQPYEMRHMLRYARPLCLVGLVLFGGFSALGVSPVLLFAPALASAALTIIFITVSRFPLRMPSEKMAALSGEVQEEESHFTDIFIKSDKDKETEPEPEPKPEPEPEPEPEPKPEPSPEPEPESKNKLEFTGGSEPVPQPQKAATREYYGNYDSERE
ncbi:MAG: hypothetical protein FWE86_03890, partial [Oscillospiraceae bacterium]|nr:hypothetical protein [Oscillospiraceae bacterium]